MTHLIVFLAAYLLDALLGDPAWLPHPVVAMGRAITGLEHLLRRLFSSTNTGLLAAGCATFWTACWTSPPTGCM